MSYTADEEEVRVEHRRRWVACVCAVYIHEPQQKAEPQW